MQEDKQKVNNSAIIFRRWVDSGRKLSPEAFKNVFLAFFDYMLDNVPPILPDPCEQIFVNFFAEDYDRYREYKAKDTARRKAWKEKKDQELKLLKGEKEKNGIDVNHTESHGKTTTETETETETDTAHSYSTQLQHTVTATATNLIDSVSSQCKSGKIQSTSIPKSIPSLSLCVSKDAGAREGAQDTHTQEVPEGVQLTAEQLEDVKKRYPSDWREVLSKFAAQLAKGYKVSDHYSTLIKWTEEDKKRQRGTSGSRGSTPKAESRGSFDTDDFFEAALHRSYDDL